MREALPQSEHEFELTDQGHLLVCRAAEDGFLVWEKFKIADLLPPLDGAQQ